MKKGFTFVELLISASIFAGVLAMAFVTLSTAFRSIRVNTATRGVTTSAYDALTTISLYVRYASPVYSANLTRPCQPSGANPIRQAAYNGIYEYPNSDNLYVSVPSTKVGVPNRIYEIETHSADNATDLAINLVTYEAVNLDPSDTNCGFVQTSAWPLLANNTYAQPLPPGPYTSSIFVLSKVAPKSNSNIGEISLDPVVVGETDVAAVSINFKIIQRDTATGAVTQSRSFTTSVTPRQYQSTFNQL